MWVERLVNDAPSVVDPEHGQVVAVPHAGELAAEPDQGGVAFEREDLDSPFGASRLRNRLFTFGDEFVEGGPGQLAVLVADDAGSGMDARSSLASSPVIIPS